MRTVYGTPQPLDWLCLAPHPDDAEIGAGGTLIRLARAGRAVGILELTRGENGTLGTPEQREAECVDAARIMGLAWRGQLDLPDGGLMDTPEQASTLARALRLTRPRVLVIPHHHDRHPDHFGAYHLAKRAAHLAALRKAPLDGDVHRVSTTLLYQGNGDINADLVVDVEAHLHDWATAIRAHVSQFSGETVSETVTPEVIERRTARLMYWGTLTRRRYAEAFELDAPLTLDPLSL
ncbi:bacillithiol biosynthesis deacetylase BshB1 [Deinococcus maricopensis]|uniref:LmbE family protein n=1 Tax=Deinococcus maricopensis (strain DSM 21211 / LMG 22137 / NRRL B-23946 / LB-34) TaxID=709986 RepID=E8U588_DEIML|nr:bacillithiol biosynthesis deacetylase BshB1 [Deinococcus maricopensis]ADV66227.1 LmbE family protein [Deinococcus maricopensis DSM 21211]